MNIKVICLILIWLSPVGWFHLGRFAVRSMLSKS